MIIEKETRNVAGLIIGLIITSISSIEYGR